MSYPVREEHIVLVADAASDVWERLGQQLFDHNQVLDIVSQIKYERPQDSDQLYLLIKTWQGKMGRKQPSANYWKHVIMLTKEEK